jgi:hypothetical protein
MNENTRSTFKFFYELSIFAVAIVAFFIADISKKIGGIKWARKPPLHLE